VILKWKTYFKNFQVTKPEKKWSGREISNLNSTYNIPSFCLGYPNCMTFYVRTEIRHFMCERKNEKDAIFTLSPKDFVYAQKWLDILFSYAHQKCLHLQERTKFIFFPMYLN
jgi:hypothetical protein